MQCSLNYMAVPDSKAVGEGGAAGGCGLGEGLTLHMGVHGVPLLWVSCAPLYTGVLSICCVLALKAT